MIIDKLQNCALYFSVNEKFEKAFAFIKKAVAEELPAGKYEIDGKELYASVLEYNSKAKADAKFEGHRKYIDIQYILSGEELMELSSPSHTQAITEYSEEKDVAFFADHTAPTQSVVHAGEFGIFFPADIHKPGLAANNTPSALKKILVKIAI